ncbi:hypothetical protein [Ruegeria sp.]|uniref:hypothetical protein n=1 Tax=Ruegeria sp. TaxID=1879320 RepID=UPI0023165AFF|nr:hypothetical protein [Ruegeria sp.]MDA7966397.1 hypothetical protein [Ruegeria sp.]
MNFPHDHFTMSYGQSRDYGIDYRTLKKVTRLPESVLLVAIAGVWGDYSDIRCLFIDTEGNGYWRHVYGGGGEYIIQELDLNAKKLEVGQMIIVKA